ncbi:MAG: hypothetical protein M0Z63_11030, partial [Actinomycetota bacterium]|nr:hypothetical protein [Actinomycetota bacterium]
GLADQVIPEIQSLSSLWILVGNAGQTKSSPGGGTAAVETNKSGIAEATVGVGEDATGAGANDDRLPFAADVAGAERALELDPGDEPPHAPRSSPINRTVPMSPMNHTLRVASGSRGLPPALGSRAADDDLSGELLTLMAKLSLTH